MVASAAAVPIAQQDGVAFVVILLAAYEARHARPIQLIEAEPVATVQQLLGRLARALAAALTAALAARLRARLRRHRPRPLGFRKLAVPAVPLMLEATAAQRVALALADGLAVAIDRLIATALVCDESSAARRLQTCPQETRVRREG